MEKNVGGYDRIARLVLGPLLIVAALAIYVGTIAVSGLLGAGLIVAGLVVGAVLVVTGATQYCPLNRILGFDTFRETTDESQSDPESGVGRVN